MVNLDYRVKGLKLGRFIITTEKCLQEVDTKLMIEPQEVWDLFIKAIREGKITFSNRKRR